MANTPTTACASCKFWNNRMPTKAGAAPQFQGNAQTGFCTFHAPTGTDISSRWPVTYATESCGDYQSST